MKRIGTAALLVALTGTFLLPAAGASAQAAPKGIRTAQASPPAVTELSAQRRIRRPSTRLRVYPRYYPGRNSVRDCTATYVEEYRPSGTVIVPRMSCYWRGG